LKKNIHFLKSSNNEQTLLNKITGTDLYLNQFNSNIFLESSPGHISFTLVLGRYEMW